jgi:uncharacterized membrane protein
MGQINIYVLLLLVISLFLLRRKREVASGVFLGISLVVKLFPILLPAYFLFKLQKKILGGIFISLLLSVLSVVIFIPVKIYSEFLFSVLPTLLSSWKLDYYNQALSGVIGRSFGTVEFSIILRYILTVILFSITFIAVFKNKKKDFPSISLRFGTLITASLLINTFSWQHHFVWLIIPFYATFFYIRKFKVGKKYIAALLISYFLISINFAHPEMLPLLLRSHVFFGAFLLLLLDSHLLLKPSHMEK